MKAKTLKWNDKNREGGERAEKERASAPTADTGQSKCVSAGSKCANTKIPEGQVHDKHQVDGKGTRKRHIEAERRMDAREVGGKKNQETSRSSNRMQSCRAKLREETAQSISFHL